MSQMNEYVKQGLAAKFRSCLNPIYINLDGYDFAVLVDGVDHAEAHDNREGFISDVLPTILPALKRYETCKK